jgi:hypothetical protein
MADSCPLGWFAHIEDLWEPVDALPGKLVEKYERRNNLKLNTLSRRLQGDTPLSQ